jgi:hypothetical protein
MTRAIRCLYVVLTISQCVLLLAAMEKPAYGYVDPGSGILLVQVLSSAIGGVLFFVRKRVGHYLHFTRKTLAFNEAKRPSALKP